MSPDNSNPFLISTPDQAWAVTQGHLSLSESKSGGGMPLPSIVSAADLIIDPSLKAPAELIKGVLHQGLKGILGGPSKAGKTWMLLDMAISVASGIRWLTWETIRSKVLFVNFEIPTYFIQDRIRRISQQKEGADVGNLDLWNLRGFSAPFLELLPKMMGRLKEKQYGLVILDPIYKGLAGADENKAGDISTIVNHLERICVETGAALVFAHHFSKGNKANTDVLDRMSGSGVFGRDPDTIISLTEHKQENCFSVQMVVRNLPQPNELVVERSFPVVTIRPDLDPNDLKAKGGKSTEVKSADLLRMLRDSPLKSTEWFKKAKAEDGISKPTFNRKLAKFNEKGWIEKAKKSEPWKLTQAGEEEINRSLVGKERKELQSEE